MNRLLTIALALFFLFTASSSYARRLKVYAYPKSMTPGQLVIITLENPTPETPKSIAKCTAEKLLAWKKSDIPILRVEQNGKQIWTTLGSYQTIGDSAVATFMVPLGLQPGAATLYLVNDRDPSVPYAFNVQSNYEVKLKSIEGNAISPLKQFRLIGEGFVPTPLVDAAPVIKELESNISLSSLSKGDQYTRINKRIAIEWDKLTQANLLQVKQGNKSWRIYVDQCGLSASGLALDFIAPPDLTPGTAELTLSIRVNGQEVAKSQPLTVNIQ